MAKLNTLAVKSLAKPGLHGDGGGLYLQVRPPHAKSWIYRYKLAGRSHLMGLGSVGDVSLAEAREVAIDMRRLARKGIDPIRRREIERAEAAAKAGSNTFEEVADAYIEAHEDGWRNTKHRQQWQNTLRDYAEPVIGKLPVAQITSGHIAKILDTIWKVKPETAARVRGRIEMVLDYAIARKWRDGPNPAMWRGNLQPLFLRKDKVRAVQHRAALPWRDVGSFMASLRTQVGVAARALELLVLTAARTGEVTGAIWPEIDLEEAVWIIPAGRMKAGKEHRIPLCRDALVVLCQMTKLRRTNAPDEYMFPGAKLRRPLSNMAMQMTLRRMERDDITVHGMRSTFKDWCAESGQPNDISEAALAHSLGSKVQKAYQRGDLLERRRALMTAWAKFCSQPAVKGDNVHTLRAAAAS